MKDQCREARQVSSEADVWTAPNGATFPRIGDALRAAHFGDIGKDRKPVRLTRPGYTDTVIAPGGPAGWHVSIMGDKLPRIVGGRIVK